MTTDTTDPAGAAKARGFMLPPFQLHPDTQSLCSLGIDAEGSPLLAIETQSQLIATTLTANGLLLLHGQTGLLIERMERAQGVTGGRA